MMRTTRNVFLVVCSLLIAHHAGGENNDAIQARIASKMPGAFGGFSTTPNETLDEDQYPEEIVIHLKDMKRWQEALEEVLATIAGNINLKAVRFELAQFSVEELLGYKSMALQVEDKRITLRDYDEGRNRLSIGVDDDAAVESVREKLITAGVPAAALRLEVTGRFDKMVHLREIVRPVIGGPQVAFPCPESPSGYCGCTIGYNALYPIGQSYVPGFVINSHCSWEEGVTTGNEYYQPIHPRLEDIVAIEVWDPPLRTINEDPRCPVGRRCRDSDSLFAAYLTDIPFDLGYIARVPGPDQYKIVGTFRIVERAVATQNQRVMKVGRTTGFTRGLVSNTCADISIGQNVHFCQTRVNRLTGDPYAVVGPGDSGSPAFQFTPFIGGADVFLLGNVYAGATDGSSVIYSPIEAVENELVGPGMRLKVCAPNSNCASDPRP